MLGYDWTMPIVQIRSVSGPFDLEEELLREAADVVLLSSTMGIVPEDESLTAIDLPTMRRVVGWIGEAGIPVLTVIDVLAQERPDPRSLADSLRALEDALEESPVPDREWASLLELFDGESLGALVGVSASSVKRYAAGERPTPDEVATRLHFIAKVIGDLRGSYNDIGVRRWFARKRTALGGRAPAEILRRDWDPDDERVQAVRELSRALTGALAT